MYRVAPPLELKKLETIFRNKIFSILVARRKISREMITMLSTWRHSGFHGAVSGTALQIFTFDDTITPANKNRNPTVSRLWIPARVPSRALQGIRVFAGMTTCSCI